MRGKIIISAVVAALLGVAGPAVANYFYPGRIIIGYSPGGIGGFNGTTTNAMVGPGCQLEQELDCECFPGMPVLEACQATGVDIGCATPDMPYLHVTQKEPVVVDLGKQKLGSLICSGKSDQTAYITLPKPK